MAILILLKSVVIFLYWLLNFKVFVMEDKKLRVYKKVLNKIRQARKILIMSHKNPDWDTIWASIWMAEMIDFNFWLRKIDLFCVDELSEQFNYLDKAKNFKRAVDLNNYDLIISLDASSIYQLWITENLKNYNSISIDHHPTNEIFCKQNVVIPEYSSTSEIVCELFLMNGYELNEEASNAFLTGIITDTWWFKHSNTSSKTLEFTKVLVKNWWDRDKIMDIFFKNNKLEQIKLWWKIISKSFINSEGILCSTYNSEDLNFYWLQSYEAKWILDALNSVEEIKYSTLLEIWENWIKWSLRTIRDDINLYEIASKLGGWGHRKASGFNFEWWITIKNEFYLNKIKDGKN